MLMYPTKNHDTKKTAQWRLWISGAGEVMNLETVMSVAVIAWIVLQVAGGGLFVWYWVKCRKDRCEEFKLRQNGMKKHFDETKERIERGVRPPGKKFKL